MCHRGRTSTFLLIVTLLRPEAASDSPSNRAGEGLEQRGSVTSHAKAVTFQLAEVAVPRVLFAAILARIGRLRAAPSPGWGFAERVGVASSRGGWGWSAVRSGGRAEGQAEGGRRGARTGIRRVGHSERPVFPLDTGMRRVCKACSGEPGEVPDNEVNAHPGDPG